MLGVGLSLVLLSGCGAVGAAFDEVDTALNSVAAALPDAPDLPDLSDLSPSGAALSVVATGVTSIANAKVAAGAPASQETLDEVVASMLSAGGPGEVVVTKSGSGADAFVVLRLSDAGQCSVRIVLESGVFVARSPRNCS